MSRFDDLKLKLRENLKVSLSIDSSNRTRRCLQHFTSLKFKDKEIQACYEVLLRHAHIAESRCPGAGILFLHAVSGNRTVEVKREIKKKSDLVHTILELDLKKKCKDLLIEVLEHANAATKLSIKKSSTSASYVEIAEGYGFDLKTLLKIPYVELKSVKVLCIDGYIENVSEIHHIMMHLAEEKIPCLFFVRGMSDDVLHTIGVNLERRTALVYPFIVPFDAENVNTIVDIAVVSGTDVISSLKGNLISSVSFEKLGSAQNCILSSQDIRFKNEKSRERVSNHIVALKKTLEERPELEAILSKRLRSISSSCIDICIPDDMNFYSDSQQLDEGVRLIMSAMKKSYRPDIVANETYDSYVSLIDNTQTFFT